MSSTRENPLNNKTQFTMKALTTAHYSKMINKYVSQSNFSPMIILR